MQLATFSDFPTKLQFVFCLLSFNVSWEAALFFIYFMLFTLPMLDCVEMSTDQLTSLKFLVDI